MAARIEDAARVAWQLWGDAFAAYCRCSSCGRVRHCRGRRRAFMLCLECWDQGEA